MYAISELKMLEVIGSQHLSMHVIAFKCCSNEYLNMLAVTSPHHAPVHSIARGIPMIAYASPCTSTSMLRIAWIWHTTMASQAANTKLGSGFWVYAMLCYYGLMHHDLHDSFIS